MHRLPACSSVLRHGRSTAARFLKTTSANQDLESNSQLNSKSEFRSKIALSPRERLKLNLILKCPQQLGRLHGLCDERQTKYELLTGNGPELQLISEKSDELAIVETKIRRMLSQIKTYDFEISHGARALLKLDNLINIRSLLDFGQEWVEVEPRGRSLQDNYIFSATGSPEALTSFKRKLNNKLNAIRYFEMPLPDYVPVEKDLLEVVKAVNKQSNTVCFVEGRVVKCWNLDKGLQPAIQRDFQLVVDRWNDECEENWVGSDVMEKYVRNYLKSKKMPDQESELVTLHGYDDGCVPVKLKGKKYHVQRLAAEITRAAREAAYINIPVPSAVMNSIAFSQFGSYWRSYTDEILVILPNEANPSLTLVGPFDCVNHRLLYFYRMLRANFPDSFKLLEPRIVYKYNSGSQFQFDESGVIRRLKQKYPRASFSTDTTPGHPNSLHPITLYVTSSRDELIKIDSVLKANVPVCLGPTYPNAGKMCHVLKENNHVDAGVNIEVYGGGSSTLLKCSEPHHARRARDEIVRRMDDGDRYRYFPLKGAAGRHLLVSDRLSNDIIDFADSIDMPISIQTYEHNKQSCISLVEGVGDFGQFLRMRNFCNEKFNFDKFRMINTSSSHSLSSEQITTWLLNCHGQVLKGLDGTVFLFQHFNNLCVGGDEDYLDQAIELFHAAMDNLVHRTVPITETLDDTLLSELKSSWPLVNFERENSKTDTVLDIVGDRSTVEEVLQKLPSKPLGSYTRNISLPLRGYPYLAYVGKKLFNLPGHNPPVNTWPSQFPETNCSVRVKPPPWNRILLQGDKEEVEKVETRVQEILDLTHFRNVYLAGLEEFRLNRLRDALLSFRVLRAVVDDMEVSVFVEVDDEQLNFTVLGEDDEKVRVAAEKLENMCENFRVEEIQLGDKEHLIGNKYISDLVNPMIKLANPNMSFKVKYLMNRKEGVITVFGVSDDVKKCADKLRGILADTASVTLDVSEDHLGSFISILIRHLYMRNIYPDICLFYRVEDKSLDVFGPRSQVEEFQLYLKNLRQETYKIDYHYENFVTLFKRLKPLNTGVLIVEEKDRTLRLVGSQDNVSALVKMLDFVLGKRKSCYFDLLIDNRQTRVHLGTVTALVTRSVTEKFPDVSWWLLGNQLKFSGPEAQASRAVQFVIDRYRKRDQHLIKSEERQR
ncbi:hypothetical protein ACHWQZ_G016685 [Mnemiopsis leidyi]